MVIWSTCFFVGLRLDNSDLPNLVKTHYATQVLHSLTLRDTVRTLLGVEADAGKPLSQIPTPNGVARQPQAGVFSHRGLT